MYLHIIYLIILVVGFWNFSQNLLRNLVGFSILLCSWDYSIYYAYSYYIIILTLYSPTYISRLFNNNITFTNTLITTTNYLIDLTKYVFKKYVYTINHKRLAINYLIVSFWTGLSGATLATLIRWELAYPGSHFFKGDSLRYLQVITAHGLTMVFFVVVPIVFGFFANFFIPYHIGSKDVAFPRLNNLGFWLFPAGYVLVAKPAFLRPALTKVFDKPSFFFKLIPKNQATASLTTNYSNSSLFSSKKIKTTLENSNVSLSGASEPQIPLSFLSNFLSQNLFNNFWLFSMYIVKERRKKVILAKCPNSILTMSGWTFITPFSGNTRFTGSGAQDVAILSVLLAGLSTTISFTNLLITRRTLSMPGLRNRRVLIPFISITLFLVMRMLALITPVLGAAMIMLALDRHWNTSFFDYAYGGDVILFHHLFWFFGHPEVYVVIIPAFGIMNSLLPFYTSRRIASKHHLIWATYIMGYMGFLVWGHHMYLVGLDHRSRSMYSTITVMISLPAIVKLVNWTLTLLNGMIVNSLPFWWLVAFFFFFLSGGLTGMWLSHVGLNLYVHDTFYVVAHFHFMFSAATFSALFAGIYHYYHIIFGVSFSKNFATFHLFYWFAGQWLTFLPLFWVGYNGLPRRYHDYPVVYFGWHGMASVGHILSILSIVFFCLNILDSLLLSRVTTPVFLHVSRTNKRVLYYIYKINYLQSSKSFNQFSKKNMYNEYETLL